MGSLYSKNKEPEKPKITEQDKAILRLKKLRDQLKQYQKKLKRDLEEKRQMAQDLVKEGKQGKAKLLLKMKRCQEKTIERIDNQLDKLEIAVQNVEFAQVQIQQAGIDELNQEIHQAEIMSIEDVERIMDETREGIEYQRKIDGLLSGSLTQEDEDAVLQELEEMTQSETMDPSWGTDILTSNAIQ